MYHETILQAMEALCKWQSVDTTNRWFSVSLVQDNWQVSLKQCYPPEEGEENYNHKEYNANGYHLLHVVNSLMPIKGKDY